VKKIILVIPVLLMMGFAYPVLASDNGRVGAQTGQQLQDQDRIQDPTTHASISTTPSGNQVQNQVSTQNQGEEMQLQVATSEMEQLMDMGMSNKSLETQVQTVAKEQAQAQTEIQGQLNKLESKSGFAKKLFGPDYGAIKNLRQQMEQNELRIQQLIDLQAQVSNQADASQLQEAIQVLTEQNTSLQEQIEAEENTKSVFGWLVRLFYI